MISMSVDSSGWPTPASLKAAAEGEFREVIGRVFRTAVKISPVYTGSFRASWRVSYNTPREDVTVGGTPEAPLRGASFRWPKGFNLGDTIIISNNLPYAERLEYGWSKQAPTGVLRLAVASAGLV